MDNDAIHFRARFAGVSREIYVPVQNVLAIYANENGQGMAFDVSTTAAEMAAAEEEPGTSAPTLSAVPGVASEAPPAEVSHSPDDNNEPPKKGGRPTLTRIK
jgi:stringent starvation protein B